MNKENVFRHGDLVIKKVESTDIKLTRTKKAVLAEGEHTGHTHRVTALDENAKIEFARGVDNFQAVFKVSGGRAQLTHEEHKQIVFDPGTYTVVVKREFDYFADKIRQVQD